MTKDYSIAAGPYRALLVSVKPAPKLPPLFTGREPDKVERGSSGGADYWWYDVGEVV